MPESTRRLGDVRSAASRCLRHQHGSVMILMIVCTIFILIAVALFALNYTRLAGGFQEQHTAIEAASLAAASDLSRVVMEDPNFGFVALTDYPPYGTATVAGDGQALPVLGINTILGTARLDVLIANTLNDPVMQQLAHSDAQNARSAANNLTQLLDQLCKGQGTATDLNGNAVTPLADAQAVYNSNNVKMTDGDTPQLTLQLGWLKNGGSTTITPVPQPNQPSYTPADQQSYGCYKSFINCSTGGEDFYFLGLGPQPSLVDNQNFVSYDQDNSRPASCVKALIDRSVSATDANGKPMVATMHTEASAQPAGRTDNAPPGTICISFPSGDVPGITSPGDLANDPQLKTNKTVLYSPDGGDWPGDGTLTPSSFLGGNPTISQIFSAGMYHFLRNGRTKPRIDDVQTLMGTAFSALGNPGTMTSLSQVPFSLLPRAYADDHSQGPSLQTGLVSTPTGQSGADDRVSAMQNNLPEGQRAFWSMAGYSNVQSQLPPNTMMVGLDSKGSVMSADGSPLDTKTVQAFWKSLSDTNAAALTCISLASQAAQTAQSSIDGQTDQISQLNANIDSLNQSLKAGNLTQDQQTTIQNQISGYNNQIAQINNTINDTQGQLSNAQNALTHGTAVASITDTICRNQRTLTAKGLTANGQTFKLAGSVFTPHPTPPADATSITNGQAWSGDPNNTSWTASSFPCYDIPSGALSMRPGKPDGIMQPVRAQGLVPPSLAKMYMFELRSDGHLEVTVLPASPFMNVAVSNKQLFAVSYNALSTGTDLPVTWSMMMRDQTLQPGRKNGGIHGGQPTGGVPVNWCQAPTFGSKRSQGNKWSKSKKGSKGLFGALQNVLGGATDQGQNGNGGGNGNGNNGGGGGNGNGNGGFGNGNGNGNAGKGASTNSLVRNTYACGGLATELQIRSPVVGNCGSLTPGTTLPPHSNGATPTSECPPIPADL